MGLLQIIEKVERRPYGRPIDHHSHVIPMETRGTNVDTSPANMDQVPVHGGPFDDRDYALHAIFYFVVVLLAHKVM